MSLRALLYAYVLGGFTFIPLIIVAAIFWTFYTSVPVEDGDTKKPVKAATDANSLEADKIEQPEETPISGLNDAPRPRKGWLTMRHTFEEPSLEGGYVTFVRSFLDARSKDPKKSRPKDTWYAVLKGKVLFLYEDEEMTECEAAVELGSHEVVIFPEDQPDGELFARRNAICLKPKIFTVAEKEFDKTDTRRRREVIREQSSTRPRWFMFVRNTDEMEDWYLALLHAAEQPAQTPTLAPLLPVFEPADMAHLVSTLDEQPDVIPMRWLNALIGRVFFSYYRTHTLESYIIGRLMKKLSKVKRPSFLTHIAIKEVSVGNRAPQLSKPMLKELTKEGDAALEVHLHYKGEIRITAEATVTIDLGSRFKAYTVKLVLAVVLKELDGNLLIKLKRPPSNRLWYAFTQTPQMSLSVEPIVSDRQITWSMILGQLESFLKGVIQDSVVLPHMDDIAFFESLPYHYRGGIWADASRHEQPPASATEGMVAPDMSTETNPTSSTTSSPTPSEPESAPPQIYTTEEPKSDDASEAPTTQSAPTVMQQETPNRRKSWFTAARPEDLNAAKEQYGYDADSSDRGRTTKTERPHLARSRSRPKMQDKAAVERNERLDSDDSVSQASSSPPRQSPPSTCRPSSRHSSKPSILDNFPTSSYVDPFSNSPQRNAESARSFTNTSNSSGTSATGFLSTLKSRDKQAIKDSAKETMRKWANNWGNMRNKDGAQHEDAPDHGSVGSRAHDHESPSRSSYAEVRAAVAQRKERNTHSELSSDADESPVRSNPPESFNGKRLSSGPFGLTATRSEGPDLSTSPAHASTMERLISTKRSSPTISRVNTEADPKDLMTEDVPKPAPIQSQPQAKMMTIPGIHASHKNEVMSMGYVAPTPAPPPAAPKPTIPSIQDVYRLWKGPGSGQAEGSEPSPSETAPPPAISEDGDIDVTPDTPVKSQSTPAAIPRMVPPPLPPRSTPVVATRAPTTSAQRSSLDDSQESMTPSATFVSLVSSTVSPSSASEALKSIASKDENTRTLASLEGETNTPNGLVTPKKPSPSVQDLTVGSTSSPPPLPPRRVQASAA
ncbi:hypothetical protein BDN72DRAFT_830678 [Pluteus cervinus]|uniref:Uncharacterized protein n=1 Tax=Pluteus cervinus TaxID=181527 RepID=A0ACD3BJV4_9AGAR|nr:hypothetical protein BDN72DRAFT_830678 [Pluteus cervinus]